MQQRGQDEMAWPWTAAEAPVLVISVWLCGCSPR